MVQALSILTISPDFDIFPDRVRIQLVYPLVKDPHDTLQAVRYKYCGKSKLCGNTLSFISWLLRFATRGMERKTTCRRQHGILGPVLLTAPPRHQEIKFALT